MVTKSTWMWQNRIARCVVLLMFVRWDKMPLARAARCWCWEWRGHWVKALRLSVASFEFLWKVLNIAVTPKAIRGKAVMPCLPSYITIRQSMPNKIFSITNKVVCLMCACQTERAGRIWLTSVTFLCLQVCAIMSLLPSASLADLTCEALLMLSGNVSCKFWTNISWIFITAARLQQLLQAFKRRSFPSTVQPVCSSCPTVSTLEIELIFSLFHFMAITTKCQTLILSHNFPPCGY